MTPETLFLISAVCGAAALILLITTPKRPKSDAQEVVVNWDENFHPLRRKNDELGGRVINAEPTDRKL